VIDPYLPKCIGVCETCGEPKYESFAAHTKMCFIVKKLTARVDELESRLNVNDELEREARGE